MHERSKRLLTQFQTTELATLRRSSLATMASASPSCGVATSTTTAATTPTNPLTSAGTRTALLDGEDAQVPYRLLLLERPP